MTEKKMTYKVALTYAIAEVTDVETRERLTDLMNSLEKKATTKKKSIDNSEWVSAIEDVLKGGGTFTPTELAKAIDAPNTQKVSSVVKTMSTVKVNRVGKKVTYELA